MTLTNGSSLLSKLTKVSRAEFTTIAGKIRDASEGRRRPVVDIDVSLLGYRWASRASGPVGEIVSFTSALLREGIDVAWVADGVIRNQAKRTSLGREADRRRVREAGMQAMTCLHHAKTRLSDVDYTNARERAAIEKEIKELNLYIGRCNASLNRSIPSDFYHQLETAIGSINWPRGGGSVQLIRAEFQADFLIAYRRITGATDVIVGNDGDYHVLCGDKCLAVKDFKLVKNEISDITLSSGDYGTVSAAASFISVDAAAETAKPKEDRTKRVWKATNPLLEGETAEMRSLMSVALGCDAYAGKTHMTPARVRDALLALDPAVDSFEGLLETLSESSGLPTEALRVFVDVMMYEPANAEGEPKVYLHGPPPHQLARYIADFAPSDDDICDGPDLCSCPGPGNGRSHEFLEAEGTIECARCSRVMCMTCVVDSNVVENVSRKARDEEKLPERLVCVECLCGDTILPAYGAKSIKQMKAELGAVNVGTLQGLTADASCYEIQQLYNLYVDENLGDPFGDAVAGVAMPQLSSKCFDSDNEEALNVLLSWDLREGGYFMQHDGLSTADLVKVADLFASFLIMEHNPSPGRKRFAKVLPKNVMDWAEALRVDLGYRLMDRCIRHARDSKFPSLLNAMMKLFKLPSGEIGVWLTHLVPPSFKKQAPYTTDAAFTKDAVVACQCSCDAGAERKCGHDKHADVHVLPLGLAMKDLLLDPNHSLAESVLTSLAARWPADDGGITTEERGIMVAALARLGEATRDSVYDFKDQGQSIGAMLDSWNVGTEQEKAPPPPPNPEQLCRLRDCQLQSHIKKDPYRNRTEQTDGLPANSAESEAALVTPGEYYQMKMTNEVWCQLRPDSDSDQMKRCVGCKLVPERAHAMTESIDAMVMAGIKKDLKGMCTNANSRSRSRRNVAAKASEADQSATVGHACKKQRPAEEGRTRYCLFGKNKTNCRCSHKGPSEDFQRIPPRQTKELPATVEVSSVKQRKSENDKRESHGRKIFKRKEWLRRCAIKFNDATPQMRICNRHPMEEVSLPYPWIDVDGTTRSSTITARFPMPIGPSSVRATAIAESASRGLGADRLARRHLQDATEERLPTQQIVTMSESDCVLGVNDSVLVESGMSVHVDSTKPIVREVPLSGKKRLRCDEEEEDVGPPDPIVHPSTLSDDEAKRCTGFVSVAALLCFVTVACKADLDLVAKTDSELTWFEEWHLYFEIVWGRSCGRWIDFEKKYKVSRKVLTKVFLAKLALACSARDAWPRYVSLEEDEKLRNEKWNLRYSGRRVVFWDGTDIRLPKPSDADLQRLTYSKYYGGNVGKGGVFLQLCGWGGTEELWTGAISDTDWTKRSGVLELQEKFVADSSRPDVPFTNIFDKGYRCILAALRAGAQLVLQPFFKRSDRKFTSKELLVSAAVAADRAANERQVNVAKRAGFLQRGVRTSQSLEVMSDVWLAWSFQANFMFEPVL